MTGACAAQATTQYCKSRSRFGLELLGPRRTARYPDPSHFNQRPPAQIFEVDASSLIFKDALQNDRDEWHESNERIRQTPDGRLVVNHGNSFDRSRGYVLADESLSLYAAIQNESFQTAVAQEFESRELSPIKATAPSEVEAAIMAKMMRLKAIENSVIIASEQQLTNEILALIENQATQKACDDYVGERQGHVDSATSTFSWYDITSMLSSTGAMTSLYLAVWGHKLLQALPQFKAAKAQEKRLGQDASLDRLVSEQKYVSETSVKILDCEALLDSLTQPSAKKRWRFF